MKLGKLLAGVCTAVALLVGAQGVFADAIERVTNGGFESGGTSDAPPWTLTGAFVCDSGNCGYPAASGTRFVSTSQLFESLPPASNATIGEWSQSVTVPESPATLSFQLRGVGGSSQVAMDLLVNFGGTQIADIQTFPSGFQKTTITIPPAQTSATAQTLDFSVHCANPQAQTYECTRVDMDDVSIVTGAPPAAPVITGTDPASPSTSTHPLVKGTLGAGGATHVAIYKSADCSGSPAASGSPGDFTGAGIGVDVAANATTPLSARATNLAGDSPCSNSIGYTQQDVSSGGGGGGGGSTPPPSATPQADLTAPVLSLLRIAPAKFRKTARVSYALSEAALTTFSVQRALPGRRVGRNCMPVTKKNRTKAGCLRYATVAGSIKQPGAVGGNSFTFNGRLSGRALKPGAYRLSAQAVDGAGNKSAFVFTKFQLLKR